MPAVSGGYLGAGQRPRKRPDVNPRTNPKAAGPPAPVPKPHGRPNQNVFTTPIDEKPFARQQREAARHVARSIMEVHGAAPRRPLKDAEVRAVLRSPDARAILTSAERITRTPEHKQHRGFLENALRFAVVGPHDDESQQSLMGAEQLRIARTAGQAAVQTGRAFSEDPLGVTGKTAKGLGQLTIGAIAAVPEIGIQTATGAAHGDPLRGVKQVIHQAAKDVSRRYGPLYRGEPGSGKQFRERIKREGAASELVDAASVIVPEGAIAGRTAGALARRGALGARAERFATEARPALRVSGDTVKEQDISRNLFRAAGQRAEDTIRNRAAERRGQKPQARGIQPRPGEVVKATRRGQERSQRVAASRIAAQTYEAFKNEHATEIDRGARREMSKLSRRQRRASYGVLQGYIDAASPERAIASLEARNARIQAARAAEDAQRQAEGLLPREHSTKLHGDEVNLNSYLITHAKEVFGDGKLKAFQQTEAARSIRAAAEADNAHPAFKSSTAEVRRLRAQADALGVEHRYDNLVARAEADTSLTPQHRERLLEVFAKRKPQYDAEFVKAVREKAGAAGLPEPAFVSHQPRGDYPFSDHAPGGARAIQGVRQSQMKLHSLGIADTRPERYIQSLARTIKYKHNWPGVSRQAEAHAFDPTEFGSHDQIANIVGRPKVQLDALSIEDWRKIMAAKGLDPRDYAFWNPGRLRTAQDTFDQAGHPHEHLDAGHGPEGAPGVFEGWQQAAADSQRLAEAGPGSEYLKTRGWKLLPKSAYDEITAGTRPSGVGGRTVQKVQGFQSRVLLGTNPSWLQMQVAANGVLTGFGTAVKGDVPHPVAAARWYKGLSAEEKRAVDEALSTGVFESHGGKTHYGAATDSSIIAWTRAIGETAPFQRLKQVNPVTLLFGADHAQNVAFRRTLLYSSVKRQAIKDIGKGVAGAYEHQRKIAGVLSIKDPKARMREIVRNPALFEKHAEFVNDILGDYSRFTARERRTLKRYVLFYGFLRYALRTLFYTLPVKHPLATAAVAQLAKLHNDEVKDLLGGDQAPWAFSRIFFKGKNGKLRSIDLGRVNPVSNPIIGLVTEGPKALGGLFSPLAQEVLDQIYGKQLYSGMGYRVHGSASENPNPDFLTRLRIFGNHMLNTSFPVREVAKATGGNKTQGDDSLPWDPRPLEYKTAQAQGREAQRRQARGPIGDQIKRDLFPLIFTKPDNTRDIIASQQRRAGQPVTVPGRQVKSGTPAAPDWSHIDWSKTHIDGGQVDWSKVDWSKVTIP